MSSANLRNLEERLVALEDNFVAHCEHCSEMSRLDREVFSILSEIIENIHRTFRSNSVTLWCVLFMVALAFIQSNVALYRIHHLNRAIPIETTDTQNAALPHLEGDFPLQRKEVRYE